MKGKAIIPLVLGLCVGLVAVKLLVDTLQKAQGANASKKSITAVQAKQDIDSYTKITPEMVEQVETVENRFAPSRDRMSTLESVVGRVTSKAIPQFAPVLGSMLAPEGTAAGMEGRIPPGFRAVSVEIDEVTGVAYQLKPNDWVDVIVVMDLVQSGSGRKTKGTVAEVILQHVQVGAIGQATTGKPGEGASKVKAAKSATLLVPEDEVPKLHLAATKGKITLAMRGDDANTLAVAPSSHSDELLSSQRALTAAQAQLSASALPPAPVSARVATAPAVEPPHGVTVYRGSPYQSLYPARMERITFENAKSSTIVDVTEGPISRGAALLAKGNKKTSSGAAPVDGASRRPDEVESGSEEEDHPGKIQ